MKRAGVKRPKRFSPADRARNIRDGEPDRSDQEAEGDLADDLPRLTVECIPRPFTADELLTVIKRYLRSGMLREEACCNG
jgi:hypothetical protein